jgi:hypothetical protein
MTALEPVRYSPSWLSLREGADGRARAQELIGQLPAERSAERVVVHDLGCGIGSMGRWLAPRLPGRQHWILHDQDPELLDRAATSMPASAADGSPVTVETRRSDLTRLSAADFVGARLVTASAVLDLLTADEVSRLAVACVDADAPALFALSVVGRVELTPADPLDGAIAAAFDAHQRRDVGGRRLLGPDAVGITAGAFAHLGAAVHLGPSPWQLEAQDAALAADWLRGWVSAASEHDPDLPVDGYLKHRIEAARAGRLTVRVHHADLLAIPG